MAGRDVWDVREHPSRALLALGAELEIASGYLQRSALSATHVRAADAIVVATIADFREVSDLLTAELAPSFLALAEDLEAAHSRLTFTAPIDCDIVGARRAIDATWSLLYWAATDLQIRSLPEL